MGTRLFLYGTLKRGGANHGQMAGQRFLGAARTAPGWGLYDLGEYPGMVRDAADAAGVSGELWEVDDAALARLDAFEGVPEKLYTREVVELAAPAGEIAETYVYQRALGGARRLEAEWPG